MDPEHFFIDEPIGSLEFASDVTVDADGGFDPSEAETVTIDSPWNEFFGTDEYVEFEATVAKPIEQPYLVDGDLYVFKKDEEELKQAQAQLDNAYFTLGHPPNKRVTDSEQVRGFWTNPRYEDGQKATLRIPAEDHEAVRHAVANDEVSVGFQSDLKEVEDERVDAIQTNILYDHVASVENGRCSSDQGCGLHADDGLTDHGHVLADAVQTQATETPEPAAGWSEGEWVAFTTDGERRHGKLVMVDAERALVREYDAERDSLADESTTVATSDLREWVGPHTDECEGLCHCGCHDGPFADEAPSGIYVAEGQWFGVAPDEHTDEHTDHPDDAKYNLSTCADVEDAWGLVENGDYSIEQSTLEARIKRAAESHSCPSEQRPWTDSVDDNKTDSTDMTSIEDFIDEHDLSVEDVLDSLNVDASDLANVPDEPTDFYDGQPDADTLAEDFDAVGLLQDKKADLEAKVEDYEDELHEYHKAEFADKAEELADLTERWGDSERLVERFEDEEDDTFESIEDLTDKIELAEDLLGEDTEDTTTVNDDGAGGGGAGGSSPTEDFETTASGKFDLRQRTKSD